RSHGVRAQGGPIRITASSVESRFPEGALFKLEAQSSSPIVEVVLTYQIAGRSVTAFAYPTFEKGASIRAQHLLRTAGAAGTEGGTNYQPPGTEMVYSYRLRDEAGNTLETSPERFLYMDPRFTWRELTGGGGLIQVFYYGPIQSRAQTILKAMEETQARMGTVLGARLARPVRIVIYNNIRDMGAALPFVSQTTRSGLITEGQASFEQRVVLVLAEDPFVRGVASHEFTHILLYEAAAPVGGRLPSWMHEGVAEYGNLESSGEYERALREGIRQNALLPLRALGGRPGTPEEVILFYGQSRSVVAYLIDRYSSQKFRDLLGAFKETPVLEAALQRVYGFDLEGLDRQWRESVGAPPPPTPMPRPSPTAGVPPTLPPLGFQPTATPTAVAAGEARTPTPGAPVASPTPEGRRGGGLACGRAEGPFALDAGWLLVLAAPVLYGAWRGPKGVRRLFRRPWRRGR
ncbi:MAG: hypothetical protein HY330_07645, partial [Chloroflexi bacterium]|nr:hypothetical protein [Chloroflexota bacterium]